MECAIESDGVRLVGHIFRSPASGGRPAPGLLLCHGFPAGPGGAATSAQTYPQFAEGLATDAGWTVLTFNFRGTGASEGQFSLGGWLADVAAGVKRLRAEGVSGVWLAGSSTGGALALVHAAEDPEVRGVATLAAPATFDVWAAHPRRFLETARQVGVVTDSSFPRDLEAWGRELSDIRPLDVVDRIPPRPLLLIHGTDDDTVPLQDVRTLASTAGDSAEVRAVHGAGHRLRHDPRVVAILLGWMIRHGGGAAP